MLDEAGRILRDWITGGARIDKRLVDAESGSPKGALPLDKVDTASENRVQ